MRTLEFALECRQEILEVFFDLAFLCQSAPQIFAGGFEVS